MINVPDLLVTMAPYVHFISFGLLILAGIGMPVSEDIVFIVSASIAATLVPENTVMIFIGCFAGAYVSDIIAYCIGRFAFDRIVRSRWIRKLKPFGRRKIEKRLKRIQEYFDRYGQKTLFFGRFIPFGVRNVLFMSAGLVKVKVKKFLAIDLLALCFTSTILFSLGYTFGNNYKQIIPYLNRYKYIIFSLMVLAITVLIIIKRIKRKKAERINSEGEQTGQKS
jgi:membrane protein DedA with SNARE-associated domain